MSVSINNPSHMSLTQIVGQLGPANEKAELRYRPDGPDRQGKVHVEKLYVSTSAHNFFAGADRAADRITSQLAARTAIKQALEREFPDVAERVVNNMSRFFTSGSIVTAKDARMVLNEAQAERSTGVGRRLEQMEDAVVVAEVQKEIDALRGAELKYQNTYTNNASPKLQECINQFNVFADLKNLQTSDLLKLGKGLNESIKSLSNNSVSSKLAEADYQSAREALPIYNEALNKVYETAIPRLKGEASATLSEFKRLHGENITAELFLGLDKNSNPRLALEMGLMKSGMPDGFNFLSDLHGKNSLTLVEGRELFEKHLLTNDANVVKETVNQMVKDLGGKMKTTLVDFNPVNTVIWTQAHAVPDDKPVRSLFDAALTECSGNFKSEQSSSSRGGPFFGPFFK